MLKEDQKRRIINAANSYPTMRQASAALGMNYNTFIFHAKNLGVYSPNQGGAGSELHKCLWKKREQYPIEEILEGMHPHLKSGRVKEKLLKAGIKQEQCEECGLETKWNGKPIVLELDHVNGNKHDHTLDNLRILCPNCHSQTPTYKGRNKQQPMGT